MQAVVSSSSMSAALLGGARMPASASSSSSSRASRRIAGGRRDIHRTAAVSTVVIGGGGGGGSGELQQASASLGGGGGGAQQQLSIHQLSQPVLKSHGASRSSSSFNEIGQLAGRSSVTAAVVVAAPPPAPPAAAFPILPVSIAAAAVVAGLAGKAILDKPSRAYVQGPEGGAVGTVGTEYDAWTQEGILEYYWGEHIHLGWYTDEDLAKGAGTLLGSNVKNFIEAKFDFVDKMLEWSECPPEPAMVLDVGCGIGGTSRHLAKSLGPKSKVQGITLSPNQVARATALAKEQGVDNASFRVMNALAMEFEDNTFDLVWACESGEHMPDKKKYVQEMIRVLKPGGTIVIATWCQRETPPAFNAVEEANLKFLYEEWAHPYFVSIEEYVRLMEGTEKMATVGSANWVKNTIASWRHSIWVGVWDPWPVVFAGPRIWYKTVREIVTLERMHRAFDCDLMTYGMMKGKKA